MEIDVLEYQDIDAGGTTTATFGLGGAAYGHGAKIRLGNITGLTFTIAAKGPKATDDYRAIPCVTSAGVVVASGGTITGVDYEEIYFDSAGFISVRITATGGSGPVAVVRMEQSEAMVAAMVKSVTASLSTNVQGNVAHDAADSGNPVKIGGIAKTANPTAVAADDRVNALFDTWGRLITGQSLREMEGNQFTTITSSTSETTIVTADATYKLDVWTLLISNRSSTDVYVTIKDATTGTTRAIIPVKAGTMNGWSGKRHKQAAANNNWTATVSASVASIDITAIYERNL